MAVKKYILDSVADEEDVLLFVIHATLENYRMAYFLNKHLPVFLAQQEEPYIIKQAAYESNFILYKYKDSNTQDKFYLVNNATDIQTAPQGAIFESGALGKIYLVNELKKADYFFKILTEDPEYYRDSFLTKIQSIPGVITAYETDYESLKSKNNLLFEWHQKLKKLKL